MSKAQQKVLQNSFGFDPKESVHHFLIHIPRGATSKIEMSEHFTWDMETGSSEVSYGSRLDGQIRVILDRPKWDTIADEVRAQFNRRLRQMGRSHAQLFSRDIEGFNAPMFQFIAWIPKDRVRAHVVIKRQEMLQWYADLIEEGKTQGCIRADIDTDLIVAELFAWIWWEDLSYLEGLDTKVTLTGSANMFDRLIARIGTSE